MYINRLKDSMIGGIIRMCIKYRKLDEEQLMECLVLDMHDVLHAVKLFQ